MIQRHVECTTANGQLISLNCPTEAEEEIRAALAKIERLNLPITHQVNIFHGGYGRYSRFDITQHKYAGGGHPGCGSIIEILEITNPPDDRCGFVLHQDAQDSRHYGSTFWEFESLEDILAIWDRVWHSIDNQNNVISSANGYKREVKCGGLTPWFYAIGNQALFNDFAYPNHVGNHPVYRPFQKFIVYDHDDFPRIKTCMGSEQVTREVPTYRNHYGDTERKKFLLVYWDDGTVYDEQHHAHSHQPRPLNEKSTFAQQAMDEFRACLSGEEKEFTILLSDGNRFTCKLQPIDKTAHGSGGEYFARVTMENGSEQEGVFPFEPTVEHPTVELYLEHKGVRQIHELKFKRKGDSKRKWAGVFPALNKTTSAPT